MENKLNFSDYKLVTYLIGSMEHPADNDGGRTWREKITPELKARKVYIFDPTREEIDKIGMPSEELIEKLNGWQLSGHYKKFIEYMGIIWKGRSELVKNEEDKTTKLIHILGDRDYVERSNFLIWGYKDGDKCGGTIAELAISWYRGIPVYLLTDCPKSKINKSLLYFVLDSGHGTGGVFSNQNELLKFLDETYKLKVEENK